MVESTKINQYWTIIKDEGNVEQDRRSASLQKARVMSGDLQTAINKPTSVTNNRSLRNGMEIE